MAELLSKKNSAEKTKQCLKDPVEQEEQILNKRAAWGELHRKSELNNPQVRLTSSNSHRKAVQNNLQSISSL